MKYLKKFENINNIEEINDMISDSMWYLCDMGFTIDQSQSKIFDVCFILNRPNDYFTSVNKPVDSLDRLSRLTQSIENIAKMYVDVSGVIDDGEFSNKTMIGLDNCDYKEVYNEIIDIIKKVVGTYNLQYLKFHLINKGGVDTIIIAAKC